MTNFSAAGIALAAMAGSGFSQAVTPEEIQSIAKEAFVYGYPVVDNYRIQHAYFIDKNDPEYKTEFNNIVNIPRVYTPEDKAIQTPNSDTPYSFVGADLRAEPIVLGVPKIDEKRYYSLQLIDWFTFNFAYVGSRATGNGAGHYLLVGPNWNGDKPANIDEVIRSETEFVFIAYRTQLFDSDDMDNVKKVQAGYTAQPLSEFLGTAAPATAPAITFPKPVAAKDYQTDPEFFNILNFVLQFAPTDPSETDLMKRFAKIGVGAGTTINVASLSAETKAAILKGMADGQAEYETFSKTKVTTGEVNSGEMFGTRAFLKNNYLYRMAAAILGIYGNSEQEAMYPMYRKDADGNSFDGGKKYTLTLAGDKMPPVHAFWSVTMYNLPASLLSANKINRYLINSPMLADLKKNADGGVTLYIQHDSPGSDLESNWLPAPEGPFWMAMRLYWPEQDVLDGKWTAPKVALAK